MGSHQVRWSANGPPVYPLLRWRIAQRRPARSSAARTLAGPVCKLMEGKIDRDLCRYAGVWAPGHLASVVCSNPPGDSTIRTPPKGITRTILSALAPAAEMASPARGHTRRICRLMPRQRPQVESRGCLERRIMGVEWLRYMIYPVRGRRHTYGSPAPDLYDGPDR
jgi:hypothetical protein